MTTDPPPLNRKLLEQFLNPRSVAIIGASTNTAGMAGRAWTNLDRTGFGGRMHLVNPNRDRIGEHRSYPGVSDIDDDLDAAIILVPAPAVPDAVAQCADQGIPAVTVCTSGFSELGSDGASIQRNLARTAVAGGSRLIGPNCIGILNVVDNYVQVPTYNVTYDYTPGGVTIVSHSGGMAVNLFNRAQGKGIGVRALITLGNEADIDMAELVDALVEDEKTRVITLFMERLTAGERFVAAARRAHAAGKPIVALKVGRSPVGQRSVESHTGALAGEPEVYAGALGQAGVLEVTGIDELLNASNLLATLEPPAGRRLGVFTVSGGESSYFADRGTPQGLEFPLPTPSTMTKLDELVKFAVPGNPFDATGQIIGDPDYTRSVVDTFCGDTNFDALAIVTATWGPHDAEQLLPSLIAAAEAASKPAVVCSWSARNLTERSHELLAASSVPVYETSDEGIDALAGLIRWHHNTGHVSAPNRQRSPATSSPSLVPGGDPLGGPLDEYESKRLLTAAGVPFADEVLVTSESAARDAVVEFGNDAVVKLVATGLVHKTELGLVRVGIDAAHVEGVIAELEATATEHELDTKGYLISRRHHGLEMIVGGTLHPTFGPMVMVGTGGVLAEHERDVRFLAVPATGAEIHDALGQLRSWPVLEGLRGASPNVDALAQLIMQVGTFVDQSRHWLDSVDLNPVIVSDSDAVAVDATVVIGTGANQ